MNLQKLLLTKNDAYTEARKISPCGPLWHSSGANNPNLSRYLGPDDGKIGKNQYDNHWNRPGFRKCGHAMIGKMKDGKIATYQNLPWDYRCMLSGSGSKGNANDLGYIQFEILEDGLKDKAYAMAVYQEAVEFSAYICKLYGLDPLGKNRHGLPVVLDHASAHKLGIASNHGDVLHWFGKYGITLDRIRQDIAKEMGQAKPDPKPPGKVPYTIRLDKGTPYYIQPDNTSKVAGKIEIAGVYTIVEEVGAYGWLKSGAGWVRLADDPAPPAPTPTGHLTAWADRNPIKRGTKGKHVEVLQAILYDKGYDIRQVDGNYGAVTENAVKAYQKDQKLTVDGWVGAQVWAALIK